MASREGSIFKNNSSSGGIIAWKRDVLNGKVYTPAGHRGAGWTGETSSQTRTIASKAAPYHQGEALPALRAGPELSEAKRMCPLSARVGQFLILKNNRSHQERSSID